jgi:very-short-patch-repair endonuclease
LVLSSPTSQKWRDREAEITRIARAQHDQITIRQLLETGLSDNAIRNRVRTGRLHRAHRGVYSLGHPPASALEHWMAAVLACGKDAALSHASAAANLGIRPSAATLIDVTSPSGAGRGIAGIRAHRSCLPAEEVTLVDGIPTTTCGRTLLDLAEVIDEQALAKALDQAENKGLFDLGALEAVMRRNPGRRGLRPLRALLSSLDPQTKLTKNDFERRLYALCRKANLPLPKPNQWLRLEGTWIQADFLWPHARLVVETDGWETHRTRQAFERDRAKDALLTRAGYRVIRITWRQLVDEPDVIVATIRTGLALAA